MNKASENFGRLDALAALAAGIIPPDKRDEGAAGASVWPRLMAKLDTPVYAEGLVAAERLAQRKFQHSISGLTPSQVHELLDLLREESPAFFKQLRADVSALYLSDPAVWRRIGFPGPSIDSGGYQDFDQPQTRTVHELKEPTRMNIPSPLPAVQAFVSKPAKMLLGGAWCDAASGETIGIWSLA